jgi:hypothetical protein
MSYSHGQATGHSRRAAHRQAIGGQATAMQPRPFQACVRLASRAGIDSENFLKFSGVRPVFTSFLACCRTTGFDFALLKSNFNSEVRPPPCPWYLPLPFETYMGKSTNVWSCHCGSSSHVQGPIQRLKKCGRCTVTMYSSAQCQIEIWSSIVLPM